MIYEYTNNTLDELIKEANQSDNKLALAITERFEEEVENLKLQKRNVIQDEINEYVVQDIVDFVNAIETDFSPETQEAFGNVLLDIERIFP